MSNNSGSLVTKAVGYLIVAFVALFVFKMVLGAVLGLFQFLMAIALILLVGYAVIWAVRRL